MFLGILIIYLELWVLWERVVRKRVSGISLKRGKKGLIGRCNGEKVMVDRVGNDLW